MRVFGSICIITLSAIGDGCRDASIDIERAQLVHEIKTEERDLAIKKQQCDIARISAESTRKEADAINAPRMPSPPDVISIDLILKSPEYKEYKAWKNSPEAQKRDRLEEASRRLHDEELSCMRDYKSTLSIVDGKRVKVDAMDGIQAPREPLPARSELVTDPLSLRKASP